MQLRHSRHATRNRRRRRRAGRDRCRDRRAAAASRGSAPELRAEAGDTGAEPWRRATRRALGGAAARAARHPGDLRRGRAAAADRRGGRDDPAARWRSTKPRRPPRRGDGGALLLEVARLREPRRRRAERRGKTTDGSTAALEPARAAFATDPASMPALWLLRRLLSRAGGWEELAAIYEQAIQAPSSAADPRLRAELLIARGRLLEDRLARANDAVACYREALAAAPDHPGALLSLLLAGARQEDPALCAEALGGLARRAETPTARAALVIEEALAWRRAEPRDGADRALAVLEEELGRNDAGSPVGALLVELEALSRADVPAATAARALEDLAKRLANVDAGLAVALLRERAAPFAPGAAGARGGARGARRGRSPRSPRTRWWLPSGSSWRWPSIAATRPARSRGHSSARPSATTRRSTSRSSARRRSSIPPAPTRPWRSCRRRGCKPAGRPGPICVRSSWRWPSSAGTRGRWPTPSPSERTPRRTPTAGRRSRRSSPRGRSWRDRSGRPTSRAISTGAPSIPLPRPRRRGRRCKRSSRCRRPPVESRRRRRFWRRRWLPRRRPKERRAKQTPPSRLWARESLVAFYADELGAPGRALPHQRRLVAMQPQERARRVRLCDLDLGERTGRLAAERARRQPARPGGGGGRSGGGDRAAGHGRAGARRFAGAAAGCRGAGAARRGGGRRSLGTRGRTAGAGGGLAGGARGDCRGRARRRGRERSGGADAGAPFPTGAPPRGGGRFRRGDGRLDPASLRGRSAGARLELRAGAPRG